MWEKEIPSELVDLLDLIEELDEVDGRTQKKKEFKEFRNKCAVKANELAGHKIIRLK